MNIAILGAGTWGIALAKLLSENGHNICVWSALPKEIETLSMTYTHPNLPDVSLPQTLQFTTDIEVAVSGAQYVVFAVASAYIRKTASAVASYLPSEAILINVAKGLEPGTQRTMTQVIEEALATAGKPADGRLVALSGPTHAEEVARNVPTSIVSACEKEDTAKAAAEIFMNSCMRVYTNTDVLGVELCGALKNIIALAAGMIRGMGMGDNTNAMLITRGIAEMTRMGLSMGCKRRTFSGLAGIGDLIVTCTSVHSRNYRCGEMIGQGMSYEEASKKIGMVVEGYHALEAAMELSRSKQVDMPIVSAVYDVVKNGRNPKDTMHELMLREMKSELDT
ncbi:MAG: NAD(P)-dependent glycerol-3-phosphate dehydrogenase [Clostridiales bacterium]|nr:NAD(P)-dependent glycerol-3-phosphate dehydrogenase [Clostridiales bacterium]